MGCGSIQPFGCVGDHRKKAIKVLHAQARVQQGQLQRGAPRDRCLAEHGLPAGQQVRAQPPVEGVHVAAVLWTDHGADVDSLLRLERAATRLSGEHRPLLVPAGAHTMWAWMHTLQTVGLEADVHAAIGDTGTGLIGFRDSHNQALQARRVAELIPGMPGRIIRFADVEVLSLCTVDPDRARAFARRVLGDLAGDGDIQARLRETLSTHFQTRFNQRETARRLGLHHNTVIYRLQQANAALGRPVDDDPVAVALALRLAQLLPVTPAQS